jgi:DNA-binding transcriptional ArsR family regulator
MGIQIYNHMVVNSLGLALAAAADPTRREILARLAKGPATIHELQRPFRVSQQAVSKHVAYLERARLIRKRRQGRQSVCTLNPKPLEQIAGWAEGFRDLWEGNYRRLDALLDEMQRGGAPHPSTDRTRKRGDR